MGSEEDGDSCSGRPGDGDGELCRQLRGGDVGSDGPGTTGYSLVLTGSDVASGLFALGANGAPGASIVLN